MRLSRTAIALVAGILVVVTWIALERFVVRGFLESFLGRGRIIGLASFAVGVAVLWLADRFDIMAPTFTPPVVDPNVHYDPADQRLKPIRPGKR